MARHKTTHRRLASIVVPLVLVVGTGGHAAGQSSSVIADVRMAIAQQDFARGERIVDAYRSARGVTPEMLEALSWLGRGALAARQWDKADAYAKEAYDLARAMLKGRPVDQEPRLPIALGAAIEVQAHVRAERGARSEAVAMLRRELETYRDTSLSKRIQKNIHLLSLEGKAAPVLDLSDHLGPEPPALDALKGKVVLLFFCGKEWDPGLCNQDTNVPM